MGPVPEDKTGIELINESVGFQKHNCRWVNWETRAKKSFGKNGKAVVSITLDKKHYEFMKRQAIAKSQELGERYSFSELARDLLERYCPLPQTTDMFGNKKKGKG